MKLEYLTHLAQQEQVPKKAWRVAKKLLQHKLTKMVDMRKKHFCSDIWCS